MKQHRRNGGPAFPLEESEFNDGTRREEGMSIRDYFAAAALQGMIGAGFRSGVSDNVANATALDAYAFADGMIREREK